MARVLTYLYLPAHNTWLMLCPLQLCYDWQMGSVPLIMKLDDLRNAGSLLLYLTICLTFLIACIKKNKESHAIVWSLLVMVFGFLPASNIFISVGFVIAERILYIPSMGFCTIIGIGASRLLDNIYNIDCTHSSQFCPEKNSNERNDNSNNGAQDFSNGEYKLDKQIVTHDNNINEVVSGANQDDNGTFIITSELQTSEISSDNNDDENDDHEKSCVSYLYSSEFEVTKRVSRKEHKLEYFNIKDNINLTSCNSLLNENNSKSRGNGGVCLVQKLLVTLLIMFSLKTIKRNADWQSRDSLFL
ncbi:unnamed protein product, partial [Meganyctiphanes norvegica]